MITSMMSHLSKNVKRYAELGYQRLGTIATKISEEDFAKFVTLIADVCQQCQVC